MLQLYVTSANLTVGTTSYYSTNLPNGYYIFRLLDIIYDDDESKSDANVAFSIESDTWRIPYGNNSKGHGILFVNRSNNGRTAPQGYYNFLVEMRNMNMDLTLTQVSAGVSTFQKMIITFDVQPTNNTDTFVPFI